MIRDVPVRSSRSHENESHEKINAMKVFDTLQESNSCSIRNPPFADPFLLEEGKRYSL